MAYKCCDCGHIFDDGEQRAVREYHPEVDGTCYEEFFVCPVCGGDYDEAVTCKHCGGAFHEVDTVDGYCEDCLRDLLDYDSFLGFIDADGDKVTEVDLLEDFMLCKVFEIKSGTKTALSQSSYLLKAHMRNLYAIAVVNDKLHEAFGGERELFDKILAYMDENNFWPEFAEHMDERTVTE